jgi:hypothetical protein
LFTATAGPDGNSVILNWRAKDVANTWFFTIERSFDGTNFQFINQVNPATTPGLTTTARDYTLTDQQVNYFNAPIYYRLNLVNIYGAYQYSSTATVTLVLNNNNEPIIRIYPTVISQTQVPTLEVTSPIQQFLSLTIFDAAGKQLKQTKHGVISGTTRSLVALDLPVVAKGWIYIKIKGEGVDATIPLLVQ